MRLGKLTCSVDKYGNGNGKTRILTLLQRWTPDGFKHAMKGKAITLMEENVREYLCKFWEGLVK